MTIIYKFITEKWGSPYNHAKLNVFCTDSFLKTDDYEGGGHLIFGHTVQFIMNHNSLHDAAHVCHAYRVVFGNIFTF